MTPRDYAAERADWDEGLPFEATIYRESATDRQDRLDGIPPDPEISWREEANFDDAQAQSDAEDEESAE